MPPRRSAQGIDSGRLALLLAVLETRVTVSTAKAEVYALTAGGVRLVEPAGDLGLALAVVVRGPRTSRCPRTPWPWARSAWAARSGPWAASSTGWPRPPGSGSARRWCPGARRRSPGLRLIEVGHGARGDRRRGPARRGAPGCLNGRGTRGPGSPDGGAGVGSARGTGQRRHARRPRGHGARDGAARGARPDPVQRHGCPDRHRGRPAGAEHLLGRVPARRRLQPPAPVGAGQDGRRHHPVARRQPHRPGQRPPRPEPEHAHVGDRHPAPHGRAGGPLHRRAR